MDDRDVGWIVTIIAGTLLGAILGALGAAILYPTILNELNTDNDYESIENDII